MLFRSEAKEIARDKNLTQEQAYKKIVALYESQPTISMRSSGRIEKQQYSTPLPMSYMADMYVMRSPLRSVLEPSAGNGMMVFAIDPSIVHVNDIDADRRSNLEKQGFKAVTDQDALVPFGGDVYDAIVMNPPFGTLTAKRYGEYDVPGLAPQMALNALASMSDTGRAAIIIGGNTSYKSNGTLSSEKGFLNYLYDNYNVQDVINISGGLYAKQGTSFPTRMILINGRR